ncbi:MAG: bifunctional phosphoribosylaminoimidazolecarboxamide formyltransferase/inosine monophosphate cyclohydrolase [Chloroflexi bacterium]|nr:bifunctional phosphoribosylaminoimidazolecarboxamide formyltransferase/inosine monophosphate cyclohydrolase [Chloroflexota bacterium]MBK90808.1 bifunctional phosphoribosylaminoimidazolecarboxamide formyltransferase/inosine monophosphate cyclohydrolase [Chloroflexota bacterium]|tara:strand:- start:9629 stop:11143 length:1515 start_codon:yes stop_codon:yes gene_type:complete
MKALISVYDKEGLEQLCDTLKSINCEIYSTGGTLKFIQSKGYKVHSIFEITGHDEILEGRVKTLHPNIHAGILADPDNPNHISDIKKLNLELFDIVVNNLYPFEKVSNDPNSTYSEIIENIDIGGPSMLRAAAKNFKRMIVLYDPNDYAYISEKLKKNSIDLETRKKLATKIFKITSEYDKKIFKFLNNETNLDVMPNKLDLTLNKLMDLRYGENPHQKGAIYSNQKNGIANLKLLHGKAMSYLNYLDADAAFYAANSFSDKCVSIVKHTNSCGLSSQTTQLEAYKLALRGDPVSAFGGIVGLNTEMELETAEEISKTFYDVIIAPSFSKESLEILTSKKNVRLISSDFAKQNFEFRTINGGLLLQEKDNFIENINDWNFVTKIKPSKTDLENLLFSWNSTKFVKSNAIVITEGKSIIGIGSGQPNRVNSVNLAVEKASEHITDNSILSSDAFFPFPDSIELAVKHNIKTIVQPGGSIRDKEVIEKANELKVKMIFTNKRHFSH